MVEVAVHFLWYDNSNSNKEKWQVLHYANNQRFIGKFIAKKWTCFDMSSFLINIANVQRLMKISVCGETSFLERKSKLLWNWKSNRYLAVHRKSKQFHVSKMQKSCHLSSNSGFLLGPCKRSVYVSSDRL